MCFYPKIDLAKNLFVGFDNFLTEENVEKMSKENVKKIQAKKKLGQKLSQKLSQKFQQIPSKNRFKIQNNNPKNGAARGARRPIFGRRALARRVVVLNFVSVFCRNLLEFLAELLAELLAKFFLGLDFLTFSFDIFSTFSSVKKLSKLTKIFLTKSIFG